MKYARTEDGKIFELEKDFGGREVSKTIAICDFSGNLIDVERQSAILKQADAIEDLCDEFVIYDIRKKKRLHFIDLKSLLAYCAENGLGKTEIRGAVWTEKGLIFAAKMNEKGEMELL